MVSRPVLWRRGVAWGSVSCHRRPDVNRTLLRLAITGLTLSIACTDRSPTEPASSQLSATLEEGVRTARPSRPGTRVVPPRKAIGGGQPLQIGSWGSAQSSDLDNRLLTVTSAGATLRSECSNGVIEETIRVDTAGRFDVAGTYQIQAGPVGPPRPARYVGFAISGTMTFTVVLTEDNQSVGPFMLTFGQVPRIGYCPIV